MLHLIIGLILLGVVAFIISYFRNRSLQKKLEKGEIKELPSVRQVADSECCGQHEVCEKESLLAAISKEIEYYDDEELDRYRGTASDAYTDEAVNEFRDILYTMKEEEVAGWVRSLQLRAVELPDAIKDDVFLIIGERRG